MARKLYVGNLPYRPSNRISALFASAGTVESVNVMRDMATGRARGFAFVEMATDEDAQKAITRSTTTATAAQPHRQRSASEAAGGGGGGGVGGNSRRRSEPRW